MPPKLSQEAVAWYAARWQVPLAEGASYAAHVSENRYYTQAWQVPRTLGSIPGIFLLVSTAASTARAAAIDREYEATFQVTGLPAWVYFDVWWFPHLAIFNFLVAATPGAEYWGSLERVLDNFAAQGLGALQDWRGRYGFHNNLYLAHPDGMQSLRALLADSFSPFWVEASIVHSWWCYRALDLYARTGSRIEWRPRIAAHYLLMQGLQVSERTQHPRADRWWECTIMIAHGQREFDPGYVTFGGELMAPAPRL